MNVMPLTLKAVTNTADDVIQANLDATLKMDYRPIEVRDVDLGPVSIVGAGPSLAWTYKQLVGDVVACNSAHDYLISKGVIPKYALVWDAHPIMQGILTPHKDVTYLLASRCHPSLFEKLKNYEVRVWHAIGGDEIEKRLISSKRSEHLIPGGSASAMRAPYVAGAMGYQKEMHFFGIDSCYSDDEETHVNGSLTSQVRVRILVCGKWFTVAPWMAMQAQDAKFLFPRIQSMGVRIIVHGAGLIPYCASFMKGIETPDLKVSLRERARREMHGLIILYHELRNSPQLLGGSHAGI